MENDSPEMRKLNRLLAEKQKLSQQAAGHRSRLKERYQKYGAGGLPNHEFLELLLTYAIPRKDVKPLAKDLLALAKPGDVLLFKGSRGMKMEVALELFLQDR